MLKYFIYLSKPDCNGLVTESSRKLHLENKKCWFINIIEIMNFFNIDKGKILNLKSTIKRYIYYCLSLKYKKTWNRELFNDNRKM